MKLSTYRRIVRYELTVGNSSYGNCAVINMSIFTEIFAVEVADLFAQPYLALGLGGSDNVPLDLTFSSLPNCFQIQLETA